MTFPASRAAALARLEEFMPVAGHYARDRNHVTPRHPAVSRLSPAIRHRLITEDEVVSAISRVHPFGRVEKFIQEVYWRRYWKSWLALRPAVWTEFRRDLAVIGEDPLIRRIERSQTGNPVIDHFATELVTTGYLHNHARMWFAAWWVHEARLPWQSGAAFFFRHLRDGDPASNTLSWRWVAGLQTPGKTYLARRENLEKYLAPALRDSLRDGLAAFENPQSLPLPTGAPPPPAPEGSPSDTPTPDVATGLWIHEEDLAVETSPLRRQTFTAIAVTADAESWDRHQFPLAKRQWISAALEDTAERAELLWQTPTSLETGHPHANALLAWAKSLKLQQVVALRPEIGPLHDSLPSLRTTLAREGISLALVHRPEDLRIRAFATGGFFPFWTRLRQTLVPAPTGNDSPAQQSLIDFPHERCR
jgi:deoxyribodipyrimidine photo-lyase